MVATSFVVVTLLAQCFSRIDVATTVSRRDLVVFPFFCIPSHDLSSKSGLLFLVALHIATSVLSCDHISVSTALLQVVTSFFWSRPCLWSSAFKGFEFKLRPQCDVAISFNVHFPSSVATSILCCNRFPPTNLYSKSRPQGDVATSCCSFSSRM